MAVLLCSGPWTFEGATSVGFKYKAYGGKVGIEDFKITSNGREGEPLLKVLYLDCLN